MILDQRWIDAWRRAQEQDGDRGLDLGDGVVLRGIPGGVAIEVDGVARTCVTPSMLPSLLKLLEEPGV